MTDIEQKALALIKPGASCEVNFENISILATALTCAIERHEAFKQEVSDALLIYSPENRNPALGRFIIAKPDPLVEVIAGWTGGTVLLASDLRAALDARGLEIRSKNDDR